MAIPVTLADAKRQLRYSSTEALDDDRVTEINGFIADAAAWIEKYTGHILVARDVTEQFASFDRLQLRAWPVKAGAALTVVFADGAGSAITVAGPRLSPARRPVSALPAVGTRWPPVGAGTITVTVRAGYESTDSVPGNFRRAMLVLISAFDSDREGGEVLAAAEKIARGWCYDFRARSL